MLYFVNGSILCIGCCAVPPKLVCCRNIGRLEGHLPPHRNYLFPDELIEISVHLCTPHQKYLCICAHRTKFTSDRDGSAPWSTQYTLYTQCTLVHLPSLAWLPHLHFGRTRYGQETKTETETEIKTETKTKTKVMKDRNTRTVSNLASSSAFLRELALPSGFRYNMKGKTCKCEVLLFIGEVVFN